VRLPDDPTLNTDHVVGYSAAHVLNEKLAGMRGAWVVLWQDEVADPNGFVPMFLSSRGKEQKIEGTNFYQVRLRHWSFSATRRSRTCPNHDCPRGKFQGQGAPARSGCAQPGACGRGCVL